MKVTGRPVRPNEMRQLKARPTNNQADIAYLAQNTEFQEGDTILSYVCRDKVSSNPNWNIEAEAKSILKKLFIEDNVSKEKKAEEA